MSELEPADAEAGGCACIAPGAGPTLPVMPMPVIPVWLCERAICGGVGADTGAGVSDDLRTPGVCTPAGTGAGAMGA